MTYAVPKDPMANAQHRQQCWDAGARPGKSRESIREMCRSDPLFWINTFCYIFEPRRSEDLPFITWPCQDNLVLKTNECIAEHRDLAVLKARDLGVSWIEIANGVWRWQFLDREAGGVCSRTDELVWKTGDADALFSKIQMLLERQPDWLLPKGFQWKKHFLRKQLINPERGSEIKGYTTTDDVARGGRRRWILADELAAFEYSQGHNALVAMQGATDTVIAVSTPRGAFGAFYDMFTRSQSNTYHRKTSGLRIAWTEHPLKRPGLYTTQGGKTVILDKEYPFPEDYPFHLDVENKPRSPAYDAENERKSNQYMAQEWDMDFAGAGTVFFRPEFLEKIQERCCKPARRRGRLAYDPDTLEPVKWIDDPNGNISLWVPILPGGPAEGRYAAGNDVSAGTGATPSSVVVADMDTGEQVAEYADARRTPPEFARDAIALCKWFCNAKMNWETNGPGAIFSKKIREFGYRHLYYRKANEATPAEKMTATPGTGTNDVVKRELLEAFRDILGVDFVPRSSSLIDDARGYQFNQTGGIDHKQAMMSDDMSAAKYNHGDRLMAAALCYKVIRDAGVPKRRPGNAAPPTEKVAGYGSVAWMIEQEQQQKLDQELYGDLKL